METQLQWLKRVLPNSQNVGILFDPKENAGKVQDVVHVAAKMGLHIEARQVNAPQELPGALDYLSKRADVLWAIPDHLVYSSETSKQILLFCFRNRIPMVGLSEPWVKAGALFSLGWDYNDLGAQCGALALTVLKGASPKSIQPASPRKTVYFLNTKTAQQMKIALPDDLLRGAARLYQGD